MSTSLGTHARERDRSLRAGIIAAIPARAASLLAPLLLVPFAIGSIGPELYGIWATALTITALAAFADLGMGNGLLTLLTQEEAGNSAHDSRGLVASAFLITSVVAAVFSIMCVPLLLMLRNSNWLERQAIPPSEGVGIVAVCVLAFAFGIPLSLVQRVQYATQHVVAANVWLACGSLASAGAFVVARLSGLSPVVSVGISAFTPALVSLVNCLVYFLWVRPDLRPRLVIDTRAARALVRSGGMFVLVGLLMTVGLNLDLVIVSSRLGLSAAAEYSIGFRVVGALASLYLLVVLPFWPAAGRALAERDLPWVRKTTRRLMLLGAAAIGTVGLGLATVFQPLIANWVGDVNIAPTSALLTALVLWNVAVALSSPPLMVQNAAGVLWPQAMGWGIFTLVSLWLKISLAQQFGLLGLPLLSLAIALVTLAPLVWIGFRISLSKQLGGSVG